MKGYFCVNCGKEIPITIKKDRTWFYCKCTGTYNHVAYFREIEDKSKKESEIEVHDTIHVNYYEAKEIIKEYLRNVIFVLKVIENTHLDIAVVSNVLSDLLEKEVK